MYLGFYLETVDRQKITWIRTFLTDTALVWHLHRYRELRDNDTWVNYSAAIRAEYRNEGEAADAQLKLGQLQYQGSIRTYLTEFRALNIFTRATGEALREKIDLAMTTEILRMWFAHYLEEFADDEGFLQATYQAGLQVERMKVLEKARETMRPTCTDDKKGGKKDPGHPKKDTQQPRPANNSERKSPWGQPGRWATKEEALKGVATQEHEEYFRSPESCGCCGQKFHCTYECFAHTTRRDTTLSKALWKATAAVREKRKRSEEPEDDSVPKQQKVAAVETTELEDPQAFLLWPDSSGELDF